MGWMRLSRRCGQYQPERSPDAAQHPCGAQPVRGPSWSTTSGPQLCGAARRALHRVGDTMIYTYSTPHHSAMNSAVALVDFRSESSSTYSLKPCIAAPV